MIPHGVVTLHQYRYENNGRRQVKFFLGKKGYTTLLLYMGEYSHVSQAERLENDMNEVLSQHEMKNESN